MSSPADKPPAQVRIPAIDAARGAALIGMFAFHITWDLGFFGLIPPRVPYSPPVMMFGHGVAISFLAIAGASLALAARGGLDWRAWWRRMGALAAAAGAITLATLYLFPDSYIFFGILHCIAVASMVALLFLRGPPWLALVAAALMAAAPLVLATPALDNLFGWSLGLSANEPNTNDWRPLLPWGAATVAGLGLMRLWLRAGLPDWLTGWRAKAIASRALAFGGRHSLLVYLVHQPAFFGAVYLVAQAVGPMRTPDPFEDERFQNECEQTCVSASDNAPACARICVCVSGRTKDAGLWRPLIDGKLTKAQADVVDGFARACARPD